MSRIIPIGKYKGQPIEVLASDSDYVKWFLSQQGIKAKYPDLVQVIINNFQEPSETPEHNSIQVKFISEEYRTKFAAYVCGINNDYIGQIKSTIKSKVERYLDKREYLNCIPVPSFKSSNIDKNKKEDEERKRVERVKIKTEEAISSISGLKFNVGEVQFERNGSDVTFSSKIEMINPFKYDDDEYSFNDRIDEELVL